MANVDEKNKNGLDQNGNGVPGEDAGNPKPPEDPKPGDKKEEPKKEFFPWRVLKWCGRKVKAGWEFVTEHPVGVAVTGVTGALIGGALVGAALSKGNDSEAGVGDANMLNAGMDVGTGLMPDVNVDSTIDVDVDVPDLVNVSDYMEDTDV